MARREGAHAHRTLLWLALLAVFAGYLIWALWAEEVFEVASKKLEYTDAGVVVSGEIHNSAAAASAVNVEVTFFDGHGCQLTKEVIALKNLEAGATAAFRTQPKMLTDVKDYTIYVNTGRNMYGN
ncbi:MAG: hypothetical protein HYZ72_08225 [Deltaproteobacteria bacterium]|nr:hypothetical protein [Deltaproteobacteria bacterium]